MSIRLRRISRTAKAPASEPPADPRLGRAIRHLISAEQARVLPTDGELDRLAEIQPVDIDRGESLWNEAQRTAGTGLDGLLSAKTEDGE